MSSWKHIFKHTFGSPSVSFCNVNMPVVYLLCLRDVRQSEQTKESIFFIGIFSVISRKVCILHRFIICTSLSRACILTQVFNHSCLVYFYCGVANVSTYFRNVSCFLQKLENVQYNAQTCKACWCHLDLIFLATVNKRNWALLWHAHKSISIYMQPSTVACLSFSSQPYNPSNI